MNPKKTALVSLLFSRYRVAARICGGALSLTALVASSPCFGATSTVFSDNFTGVTTATLNGAGWYSAANSGSSTAWTVTTDNTSPLSGASLTNPGGSSSNTAVFKQFSTVSLTEIGDSISLTMDFHARTNASGSFSVGLLNSANTITADSFGGTNPMADADGYGTLHALSANATSPTYRNVVNNAFTPTLLSTVSQSLDVTDNLGHSYTFKISVVESGILLESSIGGTALDSYLDTGSTYFNFNTLKILVPVASAFTLDNIVVTKTTAIPEASSTCLIFGCMALLWSAGGRNRFRRVHNSAF
jgi:hypothetical protein